MQVYPAQAIVVLRTGCVSVKSLLHYLYYMVQWHLTVVLRSVHSSTYVVGTADSVLLREVSFIARFCCIVHSYVCTYIRRHVRTGCSVFVMTVIVLLMLLRTYHCSLQYASFHIPGKFCKV